MDMMRCVIKVNGNGGEKDAVVTGPIEKPRNSLLDRITGEQSVQTMGLPTGAKVPPTGLRQRLVQPYGDEARLKMEFAGPLHHKGVNLNQGCAVPNTQFVLVQIVAQSLRAVVTMIQAIAPS
jgi:hypothetical protein